MTMEELRTGFVLVAPRNIEEQLLKGHTLYGNVWVMYCSGVHHSPKNVRRDNSGAAIPMESSVKDALEILQIF